MIHNLQQIHSIYIFCLNKDYHQEWSARYGKVRGVHTDILDICQLLKSDILKQLKSDYGTIRFDIVHRNLSSSNETKDENVLIYSKLMKIFLLNMDSADHGKRDMINYCRTEYRTEYQTQLINDFERNYSQQDPIWWYTKNNLFQGIINRALAMHDLYTLCSMYRFLKDLDKKLEQLDKLQRTSNEPLKLYFSQFLSKYDFDRIRENQGELMCINQFLSVNREQGIALMCLKQPSSSSTNRQRLSVLFQISIDQSVPSNVFYANIGSISQFVHEHECLISMCSIYRIERIDKLSDCPSINSVHLTLLPQNDMQYENLTHSIQKDQLNDDFDLTELGYKLKDRLNIFKSATKLFKRRFFQYPQDLRRITLHYNLGLMFDTIEEYDKSIEIYRSVIQLLRCSFSNNAEQDDICSVPFYGNMGLTYQQQDKFVNALTTGYKALGIVLNTNANYPERKELESACYYNLGLIHNHHQRLKEAKDFYELALNTRREYLPIGHPDVTSLQRLITLLSPRSSDTDSTLL